MAEPAPGRHASGRNAPGGRRRRWLLGGLGALVLLVGLGLVLATVSALTSSTARCDGAAMIPSAGCLVSTGSHGDSERLVHDAYRDPAHPMPAPDGARLLDSAATRTHERGDAVTFGVLAAICLAAGGFLVTAAVRSGLAVRSRSRAG